MPADSPALTFRERWVNGTTWSQLTEAQWAAMPVGTVRTLARAGAAGPLYLRVEKTAPQRWRFHPRDDVPEWVLAGMKSTRCMSRLPRTEQPSTRREPRRVTRVTPAILAARLSGAQE
jgi:hypothetical protein